MRHGEIQIFGRIASSSPRYGMPIIGGWLATLGDASAYQYLLQGIREFPSAERLAVEICDAGFADVCFERLSFGIVAIHRARKPG